MATKERTSEQTEQRVLTQYGLAEAERSSAVLSCGGIYIPHKGNSRSFHEIINTPGGCEAVKVVSISGIRNILREVMKKESLN